MTYLTPAKLRILSEFFINLAAGWFGAAIIVPNFSGLNTPNDYALLIFDVLFGIVSILVAFELGESK